MDGDLHVQILDEECQGSIKFYNKTKDDIIFQQDSESKHTCKKDKQWFCYIQNFLFEYSFDYLITITNQFTINAHT